MSDEPVLAVRGQLVGLGPIHADLILHGRRREARRSGGRRFDELSMNALATDFESPVLRPIVFPEE